MPKPSPSLEYDHEMANYERLAKDPTVPANIRRGAKMALKLFGQGEPKPPRT